MSQKTKYELADAINSTLAEVQELLKKSDVLKKDGEEEEADGQAPASDALAHAGAPEGEMPPAPEGEMPAEGEMPPAPEGEMPAEGEQAPDAEMNEMAAHAKELSDEELDMMLDLLMKEKESRHAAAAPEAAPEAAPAPEMDEAMKSMKSEFAGLAKSIAALKGEIDGLRKSQAPAKRPAVVTKPVATNNVQVLQKSEPVVEPLNKSDTLRFLESEQRRGNKSINTDMIAGVNACRDESELRAIQKEIAKIGIKLPSA